MKYPKEYLDEIKFRLKVSQVVGKFLKLKKRGKEFIALSPFSNEKTPSFTINDEKGFYHCFSSGEHGNIFDYLIKTQNLKFGEAVRTLATQAGMPIYKFTKQDEDRENRWKLYISIFENYSELCHNNLISNPESNASKYLKRRGLTKDEINYFKIGYAHLNNNFYSKLKEKFTPDQIQSTGIFYYDEKKSEQFDRFRDRIIFPVKNFSNTTIALGARSISDSKYAKYINSPETEFFKKGNNLYNINNMRQLNNEHNEIFIVEGYMDVINLHKFGIKNAVANMGTALTEQQLNLIWRVSKNVIICLDGDSSGKKAALRAAERLFPIITSGCDIYFLELPENLDPDSYVRQNGKKSFLDLSKSKREIQNFIWDSYYAEINKNSPQSLALFEKKIKQICYQIKDETLRKYYLDYFNKKLYELTPSLNIAKNRNINYKKIEIPLQKTKTIFDQRLKFSDRILKEYSIIYLIINNLDYFCDKIETISELKLSDNSLNKLRSKLISYLIKNNKLEKKQIDHQDLDTEFGEIIKNVNKFAPVQLIAKNKNKEDIFNIFFEIVDEIEQLELNDKITTLEAKVAKEMDEKLYNELLSLKSHRKSG